MDWVQCLVSFWNIFLCHFVQVKRLAYLYKKFLGNKHFFCRNRGLLYSVLLDLDGPSKNRTYTYDFTFDHVFSPCDSQQVVFEELAQLSQSALDGYNVCVFAYGQTGSGKTFTMEGVTGDKEKEGIIPRTVKHIFATIDQLKDKG